MLHVLIFGERERQPIKEYSIECADKLTFQSCLKEYKSVKWHCHTCIQPPPPPFQKFNK